MNERKLARLEEGLNGVAQRVLSCVPIQTPWSKDQIACELRRKGYGAERNVIDGCLDTLRGRGLIKEPERGRFIRAQARPAATPEPAPIFTPKKPQPQEAPMAVAPTRTVAVPSKKDTLSKLGAVAQSLRQKADEIDALAIEMEERFQDAERDLGKLRQLQALLKSLGEGAAHAA